VHQRTWSDRTPGKPRLLVEDASGVAAISDHSLFREAGFDVAVCGGPDGTGPCPLVAGGHCELAEAADVVFYALDIDEPLGREVLQAHLRPPASRPVVVAPRHRAVDDLVGDVLEAASACTVLHPATSVGGQIRALRRALVGRKAPAP
jgi:hypothetical protein